MRAAILLAAGGSRRFGKGDKLMARLGGRPVVLHALERAKASGARRVVVVVPSLGGRVGRLIAQRRTPRLHVARAAAYKQGLGASLAAALAALRPIEREVLIFLGDMPFAGVPRGARLRAGHDAVRPFHCGKPGHPLIVRTAAARRRVQEGDQGLASVIELGRVVRTRGSTANLFDIDTPARLARARRILGSMRMATLGRRR